MSIARTNRRRIQVQGREFLWWVYEELEELAAMTIGVASVDKAFIARYPIHQPEETRHLTVLGREFPGLPEKRPGWASVRCPAFTQGEAVKPSDVRRLIEWCLYSERELVQLDWRGRELVAEAR